MKFTTTLFTSEKDAIRELLESVKSWTAEEFLEAVKGNDEAAGNLKAAASILAQAAEKE